MFESDGGPGVSADGGGVAAVARLRAILPARPAGRVRLTEGPIERARPLAPGVYQAPGRSSGWAPGSSGVPGGHAWPGQADGPRPGPALASRLNAADPAGLSSYDLLEAAAGWERLIGWAQARQGEVIAEFARRRPGPDAPDQPGRRVSEFAADEVAARLRIGRRAADLRLAIALDLADRLPATRLALREGRIDLAKARAVAEHTANLTDPASRRAVEERVLRRADSQTTSELRRSLLRAVAAVDSRGRGQTARQGQGGAFPRPAPAAGRDGRDHRPAARRRRHRGVHRRRHAGPLRRPTGSARHRRPPRRRPGRPVPGRAHPGRPRPRRPPPRRRRPPPRPADGAVHAAGSATPSRRQRRGTRKHRRQPGRGPHIRVTVAASTLLGLDEQPGELAGYGPIPAAMARQIAADPDATWRRLLTDPVSGVLLDHGVTVYRPPPSLARHVKARDQVCAFPGCRQPAERCDLDHRKRFPDGPTSADNLGPAMPPPPPRQNRRRLGLATRPRRHHHLDRTHRPPIPDTHPRRARSELDIDKERRPHHPQAPPF